MSGLVVKRIAIAGSLLVIGTFVVRDIGMGGGPAAGSPRVDPAPPGCQAFRQHAARDLLGDRAIGVDGKGEMPDAECTWSVPGTTTGAALYAQTPSSLHAGFPGLTLEQVLRKTRPEPSPPGELVADVTVNGRPGWSTVMIASPDEAVTKTAWLANGKLYSLAMRRRTVGVLEKELSDIHPAVLAIDRRVSP